MNARLWLPKAPGKLVTRCGSIASSAWAASAALRATTKRRSLDFRSQHRGGGLRRLELDDAIVEHACCVQHAVQGTKTRHRLLGDLAHLRKVRDIGLGHHHFGPLGLF